MYMCVKQNKKHKFDWTTITSFATLKPLISWKFFGKIVKTFSLDNFSNFSKRDYSLKYTLLKIVYLSIKFILVTSNRYYLI